MAQFTIHGTRFEIGREDVIKTLEKTEPGRITKYFVEIDDKRYPIKQVLSEVLGIHLVGFTSMDAFRVLEKLGFKVKAL